MPSIVNNASQNVQTNWVRIIAVFILLAGSGCPPVSQLPIGDPNRPFTTVGRFETRTFNEVNAIRVSHGLSALIRESAIDAVAIAHSEDMMARDYFAHESPEGQGVGDRLTEAGVPWRGAGENLAWTLGHSDPVPVSVDGWMNSPGHRANILNENWTHTGMGIAYDGREAYITQVFVRYSKSENPEEDWIEEYSGLLYIFE